MKPKFSAVAFDLDGTLYPNRRLYAKLLPFGVRNWRLLIAFSKAREIIRQEQEKSPASVRPDFYDYQAMLTAKMLNAPADVIKQKIETLMYRGWEPLFSNIKLFPHVRELLAELRAAGLKLGLLSDFPPKAKLENLGLAGLWDTVLCSEEVGALKPSVHPFNARHGTGVAVIEKHVAATVNFHGKPGVCRGYRHVAKLRDFVEINRVVFMPKNFVRLFPVA